MQILLNAICTLIFSQLPNLPLPPFKEGVVWVIFSPPQFSPSLLWSKATGMKTTKSVNTSDFNLRVDFQRFLHEMLSLKICLTHEHPRRLFGEGRKTLDLYSLGQVS